MLRSPVPWRPAGLNAAFDCLRVGIWDPCLFLSLPVLFPLHFVSDTFNKNHERICPCTQMRREGGNASLEMEGRRASPLREITKHGPLRYTRSFESYFIFSRPIL